MSCRAGRLAWRGTPGLRAARGEGCLQNETAGPDEKVARHDPTVRMLERVTLPTWSRSPRSLRAPFRTRTRPSAATSSAVQPPQPRNTSVVQTTAATISRPTNATSEIDAIRRRRRRRARVPNGDARTSAAESRGHLISGFLTKRSRAGRPCRGAMLKRGCPWSARRASAQGTPVHGPEARSAPCVRRHREPGRDRGRHAKRGRQESTGGGSSSSSLILR